MPSSREIIKALEANGWKRAAVKGSHHQFTHPTKAGRVTIPDPKKDLTTGTVRSIYRQAGLDWSGRK
jgi:predicted RNA binding protein YcfA (HicA-like mRNA interferase family)